MFLDLGHESGLYIRRGIKATEDSVVMGAVRAAGAIPLAVTNTPELCLWLESRNKLFGTTRNPYDTRRTCGGSSGKSKDDTYSPIYVVLRIEESLTCLSTLSSRRNIV